MATAILPVRRPIVQSAPSSLVRLQHAARECSVSTSSVRRACNEGLVPVVVLSSGHRRVKIADVKAHFLGMQPEDTGRGSESENTGKVIAIYSRVSSDGQKDYLVGQVQRLEEYVKEKLGGKPSKRSVRLPAVPTQTVSNSIASLTQFWPGRLARWLSKTKTVSRAVPTASSPGWPKSAGSKSWSQTTGMRPASERRTAKN